MATRTTNYDLYKPDANDDFENFREEFNDNMDIIDENLGGGGGGGDVVDVEVNGVSVLDPDDKIAKITSYKEVTESEYESIPVAERETNGVAYFIKDLNNDNVQGYPPLIYSDEEREVGVWRDGKPLYQKTIIVNSVVSGNNTINHGINNIDEIVNSTGTFFSNADNSSPIPNGNLQSAWSVSMFDFGITNFKISVGSSWIQYFDHIQVTLQYTKTTDTPGSGIWNGQGCYAHHYSISETVIGTWVDGKPIYETSFPITTRLAFSANTWVDMGINQGDKYKIIDGKVIMDYQDAYSFQNLQFGWINNKLVGNSFRNFEIEANHGHVVLQYTKTTD